MDKFGLIALKIQGDINPKSAARSNNGVVNVQVLSRIQNKEKSNKIL